jgi:hypothetical protein
MDMSLPTYDIKEYSPEESLRLAEWSPGGFRDESETLYKTAKGNYFILSRPGLIERIKGSQSEGGWLTGTVIRPLSPVEACAWCEETGNYEVIDEHLFFLRLPA